MLKHDLLKMLTVEQWAKFKRFVSNRPIPVFVDSDGVGHPDFPTPDIHEFITNEEKMNGANQSQASNPSSPGTAS